jgi:hypothetical protein
MTLSWKKCNASAGLYIRLAQSGSAILGSLKVNDVVEVDNAHVNGWYRLIRWYRGTLQMTLPNLTSSWCSGSYLVPCDAPIIDPPTPEPTSEFPAEVFLSLTPTGEHKRYLMEG